MAYQNTESKLEFSAPECTVVGVVVYRNLAEVSRLVSVSLTTGNNEVLVKNLPPSIDSDSIRVEGKGSATIHEVCYNSKYITPDKAEVNTQKTALESQLKELKLKREVLEARITRVTKQRDVLNDLANNLVQPQEKKGVATPLCTHLDDKLFQGLSQFLTFYDKNASNLDDELHQLKQEKKKLSEEIDATTTNYNNLGKKNSSAMIREVSILLEATQDGDAELIVSYVVHDAGWAPSYDLRVFSKDNILKVLYYGNITQITEEDWIDAPILLSTALPQIGGSIPELKTQRIFFKRYNDLDMWRDVNCIASKSRRTMAAPSKRFRSISAKRESGLIGMLGEEDIGEATTEAHESMTSTNFEIARKSTIPSDNKSHKVSIAIIDLNPEFQHVSVPRQSMHAFVKAKVTNTSNYVLLAGPTSIFLDNNFVAKAEIKDVSPMEEFTCSLGVDQAVKVTYKPIKKYRQQTGVFSYKTTIINHEQTIELKNTKRSAIKLFVSDNLPLSKEEKIK